MERRSVFSERSTAAQYANSDEEEDGYDSPNVKRRGASVDDFLKGSELGKQVSSLVLLSCQVPDRKGVFCEAQQAPGHHLIVVAVLVNRTISQVVGR